MAQNKVTIDVEARFVDNISSAAAKANKTIDDLEKRKPKVTIDAETGNADQKLGKVERKLDEVGRKHPNPTVSVNDEASSKLVGILDKAQNFANKVYTATVKIRENGTLDTLGKMDNAVRSIMGRGNSQTFTMKMRDFITHPLKSITSKLLNVKTLIAGIATGWAAKKFVIDPVKQYADYEDLVTQFAVLLGSQEKAQKRIEDLTTFAGQTPFTRDEIYQASRVLQTQTQGALATPDATGGLRMIGDIAAGTGHEYTQVATYMGRLYNEVIRGANGQKMAMGDSLAFLREAGALSADQEKNIQKIAAGSGTVEQKWEQIADQFSRFDGMMLEMSDQMNNLMLGVKSFITNNVWKKLGEGFSSSLKPFLKDFRTWRGENKDLISKMGNGIKNMAAKSSKFVLDAVQNTASRAYKIMNTTEFKDADLFGKASMLWKGAIKNPFKDWWDGTVKPWWDGTVKKWLTTKAQELGKTLGTGLSAAIVGIFGGDTAEMMGDGLKIGTEFVKSFASAINENKGAIAAAIGNAIQSAFREFPLWAKALLAGRMIGSGANMAKGMIGGIGAFANGAAAFLGGANSGKGLLGFGTNVALTGVQNASAATQASVLGLSSGATAALGLGAVAGGVLGAGTAIKGGAELYQGFKNNDDTKKETGTVKLASVGAGAAIGTAILPGLGTAIGAGVGAIGGILGSKAIQKRDALMAEADSLGALKKAAESNAKAQEMYDEKMARIAKNIKGYYGDISLSAEEANRVARKMVGNVTKEMTKFSDASKQADTSFSTLESTASDLSKWNWKAGMGLKLTKSERKDYKKTMKEYMDGAQKYVEDSHYSFDAAVDVLFKTDNKTSKSLKELGKNVFGELSGELGKLEQKQNKVIADVFADGKVTVDEQKLLTQLQEKVQNVINDYNEAKNQAKLDLLISDFSISDLDESTYNQVMKEAKGLIEEKSESRKEAAAEIVAAVEVNYKLNPSEENAQKLAEAKTKADEMVKQGNAEDQAALINVPVKLLVDQHGDLFEGDPVADINTAIKVLADTNTDPIDLSPDQSRILFNMPEATDAQVEEVNSFVSNLFKDESINDFSGITIDEAAYSSKLAELNASMDEKAKAELSAPIQAQKQATVNVGVDYVLSPSTLNVPGGMITGKFTPSTNFNNELGPKKYRGGIVYPFGMNVPGFSDGGTVRGGAQLITVAEEGSPEMIIPLSSQRRRRGLDLWAQAGHMMGVPGFANGGIVGGNADEGIRYQNTGGSAAPSSQGAQINVGGVTVEVNVDGGGDNPNIASAIAAQGEEIAETVAGILAEAFSSQFENTPNKGVA